MTAPVSPLDAAFRAASPRLNPRAAYPAGVAVFTAAVLFWFAALAAAWQGEGLAAFAFGIAFILYDGAQSVFVAAHAQKLFRPPAATLTPPLRLSVIVAAYNEAGALPATLARLDAQSRPPHEILIADDGSTDATPQTLAGYGLKPPVPGGLARAGRLKWLRLPHRGKAHALNAALEIASGDVVVTVDADTLLDRDALAEMARAFGDPDLVVAGGVLEPRCRGGRLAFALQSAQRYEYVRNFLARFAWGEHDALLLISGAFAAFRTRALREVGGFDPQSLVEDYEAIHRLQRRAREAGTPGKVRIVGAAFATTDAPASVPAFLRQRRRWFAGFLQTQWWNRDMIANPRYGALGLVMLPIKCLDAAQPFYGLAALATFAGFALTGRGGAALPAGALALAKIGFDVVWLAFALEAHRRWTGGRAPRRLALGLVCMVCDPLLFQPLRQIGAVRGWFSLLAGNLRWGRASRPVR